MDFKVILQPLALDDLEAIVRHVAERTYRPRIGSELRFSTGQKLLRNFRNAAGIFGVVPAVRKLVLAPYLIFYRVDSARRCVDVLRFWHGAQNPRDLQLE